MPDLQYCIKEFEKLFPKVPPVNIVYEYDKDRYLFFATKPSGRHSYGALFLVKKDGSEATDYNPLKDSANFNRITRGKPLYSREK